MSFIPNAKATAKTAMQEVNVELADKYADVIDYLSKVPSDASAMRGKKAPTTGTEEYIRAQAIAFSESRKRKAPQPPSTIPDELVSLILNKYFGVAENILPQAKELHQLAMGAENLVGDLLERYLATVLEPRGWVWCSGSMVKAVDFIKPPQHAGEQYRLLQVKNRDNSENSSSSAIRLGTTIEKWHRTFSKKVGSNWVNFPEPEITALVSEEQFIEFVSDYLLTIKSQQQATLI